MRISVIFALSFMLAACASDVESAETHLLLPEQVFDIMLDDGLTCQAQQSIVAFNDVQHQQLADMLLRSELTIDQRHAIIENREPDCFPTHGDTSGDIGTSTEAITGTYSVVFIPEGTTSGNYASYVFRDSSSSSWMCNSGSPESPADFVVHFHLQGAYYSRNQLELDGQNWWGDCYLQSTNASRVYSDDDVRTCVGYWTTVLCGGTPPQTTDMVIGL